MTDFNSKPVKDWNNTDVRVYAASIGLASIDGKLAENEVQGADLLALSEDEMKDDLGISKLLARKLKSHLPGAAPPPAEHAAPEAAPAVYVINNTPAPQHAPAPVVYAAPPPVVYGAPPVVYAAPPPVVYAAPPPQKDHHGAALVAGIMVGEDMERHRRREAAVIVEPRHIGRRF